MSRDDSLAGISAVFQLSGNIDASTRDQCRADADRILGTPGLRRLIVDLGQVEFMDSTGIGLLVSIRSRCVADDVALELRHVSRRVHILLDLSGLAGAFRLVDPRF